MPLTPAERNELIGRYEHGPVLLRDAFARVPREAWKWRPGENRWSVHEIVCHCADSETNAAMRIRYLVTEDKPHVLGYDQAKWATALDYHHQARIELALAAVDVMRAHTVNLLRHLPESAWSIVGTHSESGTYGTEDWLRIYAEHLEKHSAQIDRNLAAWRAEETTPR
jgi:hypothetical protein